MRSNMNNISFFAKIRSRERGVCATPDPQVKRHCSAILRVLFNEQCRWETAILRANELNFTKPLRMFAMPNLRTLDFGIQHSSSDSFDINHWIDLDVGKLAASSVKLHHLSLSTEAFYQESIASRLPIFVGLTKLSLRIPSRWRSGYTYHHAQAMVNMIRQAPNVEHLKIEGGVSVNDTDYTDPPYGDIIELRRLRSFVLEHNSLLYREELFARMKAPALQYLACDDKEFPFTMQRALKDFLSRSQPPLTHFELCLPPGGPPDMLRPILELIPCVEELTLKFDCWSVPALVRKIGVICEIASNPICPKLRALRLIGEYESSSWTAKEHRELASSIVELRKLGMLKEVDFKSSGLLGSLPFGGSALRLEEGLRNTYATEGGEWCQCDRDVKQPFKDSFTSVMHSREYYY